MKAWLFALAVGASAQGGTPFVSKAERPWLTPPLTMEVGDEKAEAAVAPEFKLWRFRVRPSLWGGMLAPFGQLPGTFPILKESPYGMGGLRIEHRGFIEGLVSGTAGIAKIRSRKAFVDPEGQAAGPTRLPKQTDFEQDWMTTSLYLDLGIVHDPSPGWRTAVFASGDGFGFHMRDSSGTLWTEGFYEGNVGAMAMYKSGADEVSLYGAARGETALKDMYRNEQYTVVPAAAFGAEYGRDIGAGRRVSAGVEATVQRADSAARPYVTLATPGIDFTLAGDLRRSSHDFYPDKAAAGAELRVRPADWMSVGVQGSAGIERYPMDPSPRPSFTTTADLTIDTDGLFGFKASKRFVDDGFRRAYKPADSEKMNARLPSKEGTAATFLAFKNADGFDKFVQSVPARSADDILQAVSDLTRMFNDRNYNYTEGAPPNLDNVEAIYTRSRQNWLAGKDTQDPILVCIGSSQFAAELARRLGEKAGIQVQAMAVTVEVPDTNQNAAGHAVAAVKTQEYGIVLVDWGKLTPTGTFNTKEAMRIYQGLVGIPSLYHQITRGGRGEHVGYLFTEEGKAIVKNLTFHNVEPVSAPTRIFHDEPRGHNITIQRYREVLRRSFSE